jgi:uncharacterized membrane protein YfcA
MCCGSEKSDLTILQLLLSTLAVAIGATLQGSIGFGLGMFAAPFLILIDQRLVPGPLLFTSIALTVLLTHREWRGVRLYDLKWSLSGRVVGVAVAALVLSVMPADRLKVLLGALVLLAVALSATGIKLGISPRTLLTAGALSGFMGTSVSVGGPPMALLYQHEKGGHIRGTLSAYFLVGVIISLIALSLIGRFGRTEMLLSLGLLPGVLLGFLVSRHGAAWLDRGPIRVAVLVVTGVSGLLVLFKGLM